MTTETTTSAPEDAPKRLVEWVAIGRVFDSQSGKLFARFREVDASGLSDERLTFGGKALLRLSVGCVYQMTRKGSAHVMMGGADAPKFLRRYDGDTVAWEAEDATAADIARAAQRERAAVKEGGGLSKAIDVVGRAYRRLGTPQARRAFLVMLGDRCARGA